MERLASDYVRDLISRHLKLRHLRVFLFDETHCRDVVDAICPGDSHAETVFGVNGAYGRHYSFLKALLLVWQLVVNPKTRFTFKIDLDQVFDQSALRAHTGRSALQLLCNPYWGGHGVDHLGRIVDLGMLAGGLVNESESGRGLFVPDVARPDTASLVVQPGSKRVFCPQWPQAVSTESEIMQRDEGYQRVHVTGGTTGSVIQRFADGSRLRQASSIVPKIRPTPCRRSAVRIILRICMRRALSCGMTSRPLPHAQWPCGRRQGHW